MLSVQNLEVVYQDVILVLGMTTACLLLWNAFMIGKKSTTTYNGVNIFYMLCTLALLFQIILGGWTSIKGINLLT